MTVITRREVNKTLVSNVRNLRQLRNFSGAAFANKVGISRQYLQQLETGKFSNPSINVVSRMADVLGVTVDDLLASHFEPCECCQGLGYVKADGGK